MRKTVLLAFMILSSLMVRSQNVLIGRVNGLCAEGTVILQQISFFDAGNEGGGQMWLVNTDKQDDAKLTILVQENTQDEYILAGERWANSYRLHGDTLSLVSAETTLTKTEYGLPMDIIRYPFAYGDSISSAFEATGTYCGDHPFRTAGTITTKADALGILVLDGDTLRHVMRVSSVKRSSTCMDIAEAALDTVEARRQTEEKHYWYAQGYRYPIVVTVSRATFDGSKKISSFRTAYCCPPKVQALLPDSINEEIRRTDSLQMAAELRTQAAQDIIHYKVTQQGSSVFVSYDLDSTAEVAALICDAAGVVYRSASQSSLAGDDYTLSFDCSGLRRGQYVLHLNIKGQRYSEKICLE